MSSDHPVIFALSDVRVTFLLAAVLVVGSAILVYQKSTEVVYPEVIISKTPVENRTEISKTGSDKSGLKVGGQSEIVLNINSAGIDSLVLLPGIGPALAARIVEYRNVNGPFSSPEELLQVKGIGEIKLQQIREMVRLD